MNDLPSLATQAGFRARAGATLSAIGRLESIFHVELPPAFTELWTFSDGMDGEGVNLLSLSSVEAYAGIFDGKFGYFPFTDCNDSNPYAVCCSGPMRAMIVHIFHDDGPQLICGGFSRFLQLVARAQRHHADVGLIEGDYGYDSADRTDDDAVIARALVNMALQMDRLDPSRTDPLRFAAQLFGAGHESELANVLAAGDEYVRDAVLRRWNALGTSAAYEQLRDDALAYMQFVAEFKKRVEAAGIATEMDRRGELRLLPGRIGPNLKMLFVECRDSDDIDEWVRRFKDRMA